jgi:hypothetical protein
MMGRFKSGWVITALKPVLIVLALAVSVALIVFLPMRAGAQQPFPLITATVFLMLVSG